jgi:hypothetical protein
MMAIVYTTDLRVYLQSHLGDLITSAAVAEALQVREVDADFALRQFAAGFGGGTGLTRRQGGWVYWPPDIDDATARSGRWMAAGSPPHPFEGDQTWCLQCGCGEPGWQHQPGGQPPAPPAAWTES